MSWSSSSPTTVYSREPADSPRAQLLRSLGVQYMSTAETPLDGLSSRGGPFNLILEAVGTARVAFGALHALAANGVCILSGIPSGQKPIEIDLDRIIDNIVCRNQILFGTINASRSAFEAAVRQLEQFMSIFPEAVKNLITERVGLEDAPSLLRQPGGNKQVVTIAT